MKFRDLFYLNKSDRHVLLTLLTLAAIALCAMQFVGKPDEGGAGSDQQQARQAVGQESQSGNDGEVDAGTRKGGEQYYQTEERAVERFYFDPNTADSTELLRLGLRPWQVRNIYKYRASGGIYHSKRDFAKLYGLTVKEYRELEPYIRISDDYRPASTLFEEDRSREIGSKEMGSKYPVKIKEGETIDLCAADTSELKTVPGIGSYWARRIADYGQRLGGYVSVEQLDEIEGLPEEVKAYFVASQPQPRLLAVNRLTLNELKRHPYINYYQARAIADYRRLHGPIAALSDLRLLPEFPPEAIARLEPYMDYE